MNLTATDAEAWFDAFLPAVVGVRGADVFVLPPFTAIWVARARLAGTGIAWGAQDVHEATGGAHTGDVSASMLSDLGCTFVEVGHSERRREHGETPLRIAAKAEAIVRHGMRPILCVGETERLPVDVAAAVVVADLEECLNGFDQDELAGVVVAYEPVWAIGEGAVPAEPDHVRALHGAIHDWLDPRSGAAGTVIYGGSVDEHAASRLIAEPGIDGLFVGRRALDPMTFASIVRACAGVARSDDPGAAPMPIGPRRGR